MIIAVLRNALTGQVFNIAGKAFEDWGASGHTLADYAIEHVQDDGLLAIADMPAEVPAGRYFFTYTAQQGVNPADNDPYRGQSPEFDWNGSQIVNEFSLASKILINKAVQDKSTGVITYFDNDGVTAILTFTPLETNSEITRF